MHHLYITNTSIAFFVILAIMLGLAVYAVVVTVRDYRKEVASTPVKLTPPQTMPISPIISNTSNYQYSCVLTEDYPQKSKKTKKKAKKKTRKKTKK